MRTSKIKMLILEGEPRNQQVFKRFVQDNDSMYEYILAENIFQVSTLLSSGSFDVIIAECLVEDGTIFDIIKLRKNIPVIITIEPGEEAIAVSAIKQGAAQYVIKDLQCNYIELFPIIVSQTIQDVKSEREEQAFGLLKQFTVFAKNNELDMKVSENCQYVRRSNVEC